MENDKESKLSLNRPTGESSPAGQPKSPDEAPAGKPGGLKLGGDQAGAPAAKPEEKPSGQTGGTSTPTPAPPRPGAAFGKPGGGRPPPPPPPRPNFPTQAPKPASEPLRQQEDEEKGVSMVGLLVDLVAAGVAVAFFILIYNIYSIPIN